eukprot:Lankesteria_metandrocarpae@DN7494_c0_g1_i1.p2
MSSEVLIETNVNGGWGMFTLKTCLSVYMYIHVAHAISHYCSTTAVQLTYICCTVKLWKSVFVWYRPEALGIVAASVFIIVCIACQVVYSSDPSQLLQYN